MGRPTPRPCLAVILSVLASACANQNSIFRKSIADSPNPVVFTVDAKQRHLIVAPDPDKANGWRTCAEAAPDVFSALSTSAAANFGLAQSKTQTNAQAKAALAIAEAAGTIERTQTINLLRESMYRTCERYLSGAIDKTAFAVQAGRDWRGMIAILAIEQLTRAARPPSTIIFPGTTSASIQSESEAVTQAAIARQEEKDARTASESADADLKATDCDTPADDSDEKKATCAQKQKVAKDARDALSRATHEKDTWEGIAKSYGSIASSAATGAGPSPVNPGEAPTQPQLSDLAAVSTTVGTIVRKAFETDETQLMCIQMLSASSTAIDKGLSEDCRKYLTAKVKYQTSLFGSEANASEGAQYGVKYNEFRARLLAKIQRTKPQDLAGKIATLEQATGTAGRGIAEDCSTIAACEQAIINNDAYGDIYPLRQDAFNQALNAWKTE